MSFPALCLATVADENQFEKRIIFGIMFEKIELSHESGRASHLSASD
jgi:hypothetical protein